MLESTQLTDRSNGDIFVCAWTRCSDRFCHCLIVSYIAFHRFQQEIRPVYSHNAARS